MNRSRTMALLAALALIVGGVLIAGCGGDDDADVDGIEIVEEIETDELYGLSVAPNNEGLLEQVNTALTEMKEDGALDEIYQEWFDTDAPDSVKEATHEPIADAGEPELIQEGTLTVGSDIPFAPFEFGDPPDYEGFDIDLVNEIANRIGLEVEIQRTAFDTIFRDLAQGRFDLVASATTITEEREQTVDFTQPYYEANQALVVQVGSDISSVEDLAGEIVGAQDGTTGEAYAEEDTDAAEVRGFPLYADAINALRAGQVAAVIMDVPAAEGAVEGQ